jgi:hypothetical protein
VTACIRIAPRGAAALPPPILIAANKNIWLYSVILLAPSPHPCLNYLHGNFGANLIQNYSQAIHALNFLKRYKLLCEMHSFIQPHSAFLELIEFQFGAG